jgi:propionaldehyde dehydrogenase
MDINNINTSMIEKIVTRIVKEMLGEKIEPCVKSEYGVFQNMNDAVDAAWLAQKEFAKYSLTKRQEIIKSIKEELSKNVESFAKMGVEETGMGKYEHKVLKHQLAIDKTPGVEDLKSEVITGDGGLTLFEMSPFGLIGAIAPSTNPTETIISNSISMLAAGNSVVFSPHPGAKKVSCLAVQVINKAIEKVDGPQNLVVTLKEPSIDSTNVMLEHDKVVMICATGGPGIVKIALSSGKKAIGAGAGNPPVVVDETADIQKAAKDIIDGCSFDNNLPCIAEKEVIVVESVADQLIEAMRKYFSYEVKDKTTLKKLEKLVLNEKGTIEKEFVGKDADYIMGKIGITIDPSVKVIFAEAEKDHPFVVEELMMPILPVVRVKDIDEAIELAVKLEHGNRHTAIIHSKNVDNLTKYAKAIQTTILVKNAPSYAGIGYGAEGNTTFTIAGPTGEGLTSARTFTRKRRCVLSEGFSIR